MLSESSQFIGFIHQKCVSVSDTVFGPRLMDSSLYFLFSEPDAERQGFPLSVPRMLPASQSVSSVTCCENQAPQTPAPPPLPSLVVPIETSGY